MNRNEHSESYLLLCCRFSIVRVQQLFRYLCDHVGFGPSNSLRLCLVLLLDAVVFGGCILISFLFNISVQSAIPVSLSIFLMVLFIGTHLVAVKSDATLASFSEELRVKVAQARAIRKKVKDDREKHFREMESSKAESLQRSLRLRCPEIEILSPIVDESSLSGRGIHKQQMIAGYFALGCGGFFLMMIVSCVAIVITAPRHLSSGGYDGMMTSREYREAERYNRKSWMSS